MTSHHGLFPDARGSSGDVALRATSMRPTSAHQQISSDGMLRTSNGAASAKLSSNLLSTLAGWVQRRIPAADLSERDPDYIRRWHRWRAAGQAAAGSEAQASPVRPGGVPQGAPAHGASTVEAAPALVALSQAAGERLRVGALDDAGGVAHLSTANRHPLLADHRGRLPPGARARADRRRRKLKVRGRRLVRPRQSPSRLAGACG